MKTLLEFLCDPCLVSVLFYVLTRRHVCDVEAVALVGAFDVTPLLTPVSMSSRARRGKTLCALFSRTILVINPRYA